MNETQPGAERHSKETLAPLYARRVVSFCFAAIIVILFYGLVFAMAFAPDWIGAGAPMSVGVAFTVLIIAAAILLNWLYIRRMRDRA
ncbi:MAG: DUF485 domain-containing protein [Parvularculaceae bacterium]